MSPPNENGHDAVERAVAQARQLAADLESVLITGFADVDTLDMMRPGAGSLELVTATNQAVAAELAARGVEIFYQRADRAAFRRWMEGRDDTAENRLEWRDRGHLLRGGGALKALGLDPKLATPRAGGGRSGGSPADRLVRAFAGEGGTAFHDPANELLATGRDGVIDVAARKVAERYGDEAAEDFAVDMIVVAEGARLGPSGWAQLVALPVALPGGELPDGAALGPGMVAAGIVPETLEIRFLPEWRSAAAIAGLRPIAVRQVLLDLLAGRDPADLPPADPVVLEEDGFGILLGLQLDWAIPVWDAIMAHGLPPEPVEGEERPEDAALSEAFDRWRSAVFDRSGCVPLALVPLSEIEDEIADFLKEAEGHSGGLQEIRDFVEMARREAPDEEVVCRPEVVGDRLELSLYTRSGRFLDSLSLSADQLPGSAEEMPRLIGAFVPLIDEPKR
jgi:hypothetical protein